MRGITTLILLLALVAFAKPSEKLPLPKELQAAELPWFAFDAKEGNEVINSDNLKELAKQKKYRKIVFSFFATWCIACREGLKKISDNSAELKKNDILVVLVNVAENLENYSRKKIDEWAKQNGYLKDEWLLAFDKFSNSLEDFGLQKDNSEVPLPKTLITDGNLRPLVLIGEEGEDFLRILNNHITLPTSKGEIHP